MGKPVKIADLAKRMIKLSGAEHVKIEYTGLRAGEKLYEEVLSTTENTLPSFHDKIRIAQVREYDYETVNRQIKDLIFLSKQYDDMAIVRMMKNIVPEYVSNNSKYSILDSPSTKWLLYDMQTKLPINSFVEPFVTVGNRVYRDYLKNITLYYIYE